MTTKGKRPFWATSRPNDCTANAPAGAGLTGSLGGGYRLAMTRRTRLDFTAGLEYLNLVGKANIYDNSTGEFIGIEKRGARFNRFGITFGIAMHF